MKTFSSIILLLVSVMTYNQSSCQIADTTKEWNTLYIGVAAWNITICGGTRANKLAGETMINDTLYLNVFEAQDSLQQDWYYRGYLREDTINNKVYYRMEVSEETGLIYDFDLSVGDSVTIDNYYFGVDHIILVCDSIDFLNIDNSFKKRLYLHSVVSPGWSDVWIEGIGSMFGLLNSGFNGAMMAGGRPVLLCCSENDTLIYTDSTFNSCYIQEFYPKISSEYYDTAYLNTYYEFQVQISDTNGINSFELIGDVIPEGFNFDEATGLLTGIPGTTGTFPCIITIRNNDLGFLTDILYSEIHVISTASISDRLNTSKIKVYPNPAGTNFFIAHDNSTSEVIDLKVYTIGGAIVDQKSNSEPVYEVDCSHYAPGTYLLKLMDSDKKIIMTETIVKK